MLRTSGKRTESLPEDRWLILYSMNQTMEKLQKQAEAEHSTFVQVLFGKSSPSPMPANLDEELGSLEWNSASLNEPQKEAIKFAMASREIALIHGPPGTGKTTALIELILQLLKKGLKLLVCGPSNISVDNIVERLAPHKVPMVRLGHPARLLPSVLNHSLDVLTKTSEAAALVQDIRKEMDDKQGSIRKTRNGRERKAIYGEIKELRKEYRERERGCVDNLVRSSKVVLSTLHGAGGYQLRQAQFDVVIIDEASQALEAQCWVPLLSAKKAVLAGDHLQLPPTIKSLNSKVATGTKTDTAETAKSETADTRPDDQTAGDPKQKGRANGETNGKQSKKRTERRAPEMTLETTLFDRLLHLHGSHIKRMLTIQYRMNDRINAFPSRELYDSKLVAHKSVAHHLLSELPEVEATDDTKEPLVFYDTQGGDFPEKPEDEEELGKKAKRSLTAESRSNEMEGAVVISHVRKLTAAGVKNEDIAVITPYNAQLALLSASLKEAYPGLELGSVDGFQGREKEAVIVSLVRSNEAREVGFLGEKRRLNVAMTRPRRQLCVVGDSETISKGSTFLKRWMKYLEDESDLRYPDPVDLGDGT